MRRGSNSRPRQSKAVMTNTERLAAAVRTVPDFPQPGIQFRDITPILADADLLALCLESLAEPFRSAGITKVVAIESRGFIFGGMLARAFGAGFVPHRKSGKLPWHTLAESYELEYGTASIEMHSDAVQRGDRVLIHDDVIATGGTANAARRLVQEAGAEVAGFSFVVALLELGGMKRIGDSNIHALLQF